MRLNVYLRYPDDADLIMLRTKFGTRIAKEFRACLCACSLGRTYDLGFDGTLGSYAVSLQDQVVTVRLDEKRDMAALSYLGTIPLSLRSAAVKSAVRHCCEAYTVLPFMVSGNEDIVVSLSPDKDKDLASAVSVLGEAAAAGLVKTAIRQSGHGRISPIPVKIGKVSGRASLHIPLDREKDSDIISFFSRLQPDKVEAYVKILLRRSIAPDFAGYNPEYCTKLPEAPAPSIQGNLNGVKPEAKQPPKSSRDIQKAAATTAAAVQKRQSSESSASLLKAGSGEADISAQAESGADRQNILCQDARDITPVQRSQSLHDEHDPQSSHDPQEANPGTNTLNQSLQNPDLSRAKENTAAFDKAQSDEDLTDSVFDMFDSFF